jgi:hypothetical protein
MVEQDKKQQFIEGIKRIDAAIEKLPKGNSMELELQLRNRDFLMTQLLKVSTLTEMMELGLLGTPSV